ncbi:hypothetical protein TNCV_4129501 [Trichonephila clavipes]|nr:hypothetical protein TNCV_4129501 [Trichonephila clavipes]
MLKSTYLTLAFRHDLLVDTPLRWMQGIYENSHSPTCDRTGFGFDEDLHSRKNFTVDLENVTPKSALQTNVSDVDNEDAELPSLPGFEYLLGLENVLKCPGTGFKSFRWDRKVGKYGALSYSQWLQYASEHGCNAVAKVISADSTFEFCPNRPAV